MKRMLILTVSVYLCLSGFAAAQVAQAPQVAQAQAKERTVTVLRSGIEAGGAMADMKFEFFGAETPIGPTVQGAPYSADGLTIVNQTLGDGTRIERTVTARLYRDSSGRVRREQTILGLGGLNSTGESQTVTIVDPVAGYLYVLDPVKREGRRVPFAARVERAHGAPPPPPPPPPPGGASSKIPLPHLPVSVADGQIFYAKFGAASAEPSTQESLGTKQFDGVSANGQRQSTTIAVGAIGNDRPIEISDERWESSDLKLLVMSHHHDPRTGDVEYRLNHINRAEPSADLFVVPGDYTIHD